MIDGRKERKRMIKKKKEMTDEKKDEWIGKKGKYGCINRLVNSNQTFSVCV